MIIVFAALTIFTSCNTSKEPDDTSNLINISTSINGLTRTSKTYFDAGDAISVYAYEAGIIKNLYITNSINIFDGESWSAKPPMIWEHYLKNYDFLAVYPTRNITDFSATDFTLEKEVAKNDLLVATNKNITSGNAGNVKLDFEHIMSKVTIKLTYKSNFVTEPIIEKVLMRTMNGAQINFLTKEVTAVGSITDIELKKLDNNQHVGIVAPQTIAIGTQLVMIYVKGDSNPYLFTTTSALDLEAKKQRTINLILGPDKIIAFKSSTINPWEDSDKIDGETGKIEDDKIENGDWGDATEDVLTPEKDREIAFDSKNSVIPEKAILDPQNRLLSMPFSGGEAEIWFSGNFDKDLFIETSDPRLTIVPVSNTKFQNSRFTIIASQPSGGKEYTAKFKVSNALYPDTKFTDFTVKVAANSMPTVIMGGLEWMAFNGCGRSEDLYMLETNMTVRDTYRVNWKKYAALCMWGDRPLPPTNPIIYPWEVISSANSSGGTVIGTGALLWADNSTSIPCPAGWRLPTIAEIQMIWPNHGVSQNGSYTKNGVNYTSSFVHSGGSNILAGDGKTTIVTNLFIISDGTNELIFPVTGYRMANTNKIAEFPGRDFYLWTKTKDAPSPPIPPYNKARIVGISASSIYNTTSVNGASSTALPEAYNGVRCVRNIQKNK